MIVPAKSSIRQRRLSILSFSLFSAWLLSFLFKGRVFLELAGQADANITLLVQAAVLPHFAGLFLCGFLAKKASAGKMTMTAATVVCFSGTLIFFLPYSMLWYISLVAMGFFSALFVASWGYFLKLHTPSELRLRTVADVLILTNILMIAVNALAVEFSPLASLAVLQILLAGSLLVTFRIEPYPEGKTAQAIARVSTTAKIAATYKPLAYLSFFILVFTINSGFMFQVVKPAFAHHEVLTAYYWAVPYTVAVAIIRILPRKINIPYLLYAAIIMIGLAYLAFMWLDRSVASYLIINTLLLGAFGVCDLFWWSILGSIFDFTDNPARVFGIGLSMNVLGVILGGFLGGYLMTLEDGYSQVSKAALTVLFTVMLLLPIVNYQLTRLLKRHAFLIEFASGEEQDFDKALAEFKATCQLTDKEGEVVELLLRGYTYKAISDHLLISENTLKFHIKNLYQKLRVNSKMELIRMFAGNRASM
ncbi:MAG: Spore germination protein GerE [Syntrophomonadaceae bacterium]|nr:Spore germination protein GerE [Bacillota bacterium]